jgi:predicted PurR-regulated permease PerM
LPNCGSRRSVVRIPKGFRLRFDTATSAVRDPWLRVLVILLTIIAGLYLGQMVWSLVGQIADLILVFAFAWIISFLLQPSVTALARISWMPRAAAVIIVYLALLAAVIVAVIALLPTLASQSALAATEAPSVADRVAGWASGWIGFLEERGLAVPNLSDQLPRSLEVAGAFAISNAVTLVVGAGSALVQVVLTLVISLYLMLDGDRIGNAIRDALPARYRDDFIYFVSSVYAAFGGFLRGQIIQSLVYGIGVALIMAVMGLPFVTLASVLAGIAIFIPFLGPVLGIIPPLLVALATDVSRVPVVLLLTFGLNFLVINLVAPKVMSDQIGLHPIVVLMAVLIGARLAGPWGALFGVPVAAVIVAMVSFYKLNLGERRERILGMTGSEESAGRATDAALEAEAEDIAGARR